MGNISFQEEFVNNKKNIVVPLLQRDYVQGGRNDIIAPFLDNLISALGKENGTEDLNYIYGYENNGRFVPIDGQQRLITLWLLHLYIYAKESKKPEEFPVELKFESREFANNFCEKLRTELPKILTVKAANLKETTIDKQWFISGWQNDTTVNNMLNTLNLINEKLNGKNYLNTENIGFDFLNMKEKGLDDDVYVKMNGRGRPLSYFENLKSWMDEKCSDEYWKVCMDNKWTDLFWNNRNKGQEHPEEIDDEQMRFFYSMLLLYWKINERNFLKSSKITTDKFTQYNYISFLNEWERETNQISEDIADEDIIEEIQDKTFSLLLKGEKMIPLYWIEETKMFNNEVFQFIKEGIDALDKIKNCINDNDSKLYKDIICVLDLVSDKNQSYLYQLAFKDASYTKTLPLLYALIKTPEKYQDGEHFYQWIRLWSNLVINSKMGADNIGNACKTIKDVSDKVGNKDTLYEVVSLLKVKEGIGFKKEQISEEIAKAKKINGDIFWEKIIIEAEKDLFFKGSIRFLFQDADGNTTKNSWEQFVTKWNNAKRYFSEDNNYFALQYFISQCSSKEQLFEIIYDVDTDNWKENLLNHKLVEPTHCFLFDYKTSIKKSDYRAIKADRKIQSDLINLLMYIEPNSLLHNYSYPTLYPYNSKAQWKIYVVANKRNSLLSKLIKEEKIVTEQKNENCDYYWGWHINFECFGKNYQWHYNNYVYLMNDNNPNDYLVKNKNADKETKKFYCFDASDIETADEFLSELKKLKIAKI